MENLENEAGNGLDEEVVSGDSKPVSVRDALVAAMSGEGDKQPTTEKPASATDRTRNAAGQFAPKAETPAQPTASQTPANGQPAAVTQGVQQPQNTTQPPAGEKIAFKHPDSWSAEAKASFAELPPHVQAAISKREQEVENGFKVLQDYKGLEQFTPYVKAAGTTFADSMKRALDWEASLQRDPVNTVLHVAKIANVDLVRLAAQLQQMPQQQQQPAPRQQPQPQPINVDAVVDQAFRKRETENQIQSFLSDPANVHANAVLEDMATLISTGRAKDLKEAYDTACWMRPDIRQQMISQSAPSAQSQIENKAAAADQARRASKSITGSSSAGASTVAGGGKSNSVREAIQEAIATAGSRI